MHRMEAWEASAAMAHASNAYKWLQMKCCRGRNRATCGFCPEESPTGQPATAPLFLPALFCSLGSTSTTDLAAASCPVCSAHLLQGFAATFALVAAGWLTRILCPVHRCCRNRCSGGGGLAGAGKKMPAAGKNPLPRALLLPQPLRRCRRRTRILCPAHSCCRNRCAGRTRTLCPVRCCCRNCCAGAGGGQEPAAPRTAAAATVAQVPAADKNPLPRALLLPQPLRRADKNPLPRVLLLPQPLRRCQRRARILCTVRCCCCNRCSGACGLAGTTVGKAPGQRF